MDNKGAQSCSNVTLLVLRYSMMATVRVLVTCFIGCIAAFIQRGDRQSCVGRSIDNRTAKDCNTAYVALACEDPIVLSRYRMVPTTVPATVLFLD